VKYEVFLRSEDGITFSYFWTANSFAEAEEKSNDLKAPTDVIYKITVDV
jgi:hypothetical protein